MTTPYAGHCTERGYADGQLLGEALFDYPRAIRSNGGRLFVTDTGSHALRLITEGRVSTITKGSSVLHYPQGLAFTDGFAFITSSSDLLRLDLLTKSLNKLTNGTGPTGSLSAAQLTDPIGLALLSPSVLLIADYDRGQLLLANIRNNTVTEICDGTLATTDGDIRSCQLYDPSSVFMVNQSVYVGERGLSKDFQWQLSVSSFCLWRQPQTLQVRTPPSYFNAFFLIIVPRLI